MSKRERVCGDAVSGLRLTLTSLELLSLRNFGLVRGLELTDGHGDDWLDTFESAEPTLDDVSENPSNDTELLEDVMDGVGETGGVVCIASLLIMLGVVKLLIITDGLLFNCDRHNNTT